MRKHVVNLQFFLSCIHGEYSPAHHIDYDLQFFLSCIKDLDESLLLVLKPSILSELHPLTLYEKETKETQAFNSF